MTDFSQHNFAVALLACIVLPLSLASTESAYRVRSFLQSSFPGVALEPSYGQLAREYVPKQYARVLDLLPNLTSTTLPSEVKELRVSLLQIRNLLDVFVFAYPPGHKNKTGRDLWYRTRRCFDEGYEVLGKFQDLAHSLVEYNDTDVIATRQPCLDWQQDLRETADEYDYQQYLSSPSVYQIYQRPLSCLSHLFWDGTFTPDHDLTGFQNLAKLQDIMLSKLTSQYDSVCALTEVYAEAEHLVFHDFRKRMRTIYDVADLFPEMFRSDASLHLDILWQTFKKFGSVNDEIFAYQFYADRDEKDKAADAKKKVVCDWQATVKWMAQVDFCHHMVCIQNSLLRCSSSWQQNFSNLLRYALGWDA